MISLKILDFSNVFTKIDVTVALCEHPQRSVHTKPLVMTNRQ